MCGFLLSTNRVEKPRNHLPIDHDCRSPNSFWWHSAVNGRLRPRPSLSVEHKNIGGVTADDDGDAVCAFGDIAGMVVV
ncbi:hypothetical protein BC938DRAFT_476510 [Jimgerdemannia flammicorona]|uniref:Uncharacterized protein n=1 Tax=Jimgerdemannia flammicorona TaxID=994334 RepID=A0A433QQG6_9FUNG|nr:hypothetical protein BC938DRAFT_476510 [Jimgerdemannia flammicorona]